MEKAAQWIIILLVPFLALAFGGVQRWSILTMELTVFVVALCVFVNYSSKKDKKIGLSKEERRLYLLFAVVLLIVFIQTLPLPASILNLVSPSLSSTMQEAGISAVPSQLSVNGFSTINSLLELSSCFLIVFLVSSLFKGKESVKKAIYLLAVFAFIIAMFGLFQKFTWNGKLYWMKPLTAGGSPFGPFVNHNHYAAFINMLIFPFASIILYQFKKTGSHRLKDRDRGVAIFSIFILTVMIASLFFTMSRGGVAAFGAALLTMIFLFRKEKEKLGKVLTLSVVAISVTLIVVMIGAGPVIDRISTFLSVHEDVSLLYRFEAWGVILQIIGDFPLMGTGAGTLKDIFTFYRPETMNHVFDYAHNEYLQVMVETGIAGSVLVVSLVIYFLKNFNPLISAGTDREARYLHNGLFCGIIALMVHNVVEFNLRIPANAYLLSVLAGLTMATARPEKKELRINNWIPVILTIVSILFLVILSRDAVSILYMHKGISSQNAGHIVKALSTGRANPDHDLLAGDFYLDKKMSHEALISLDMAVETAPFRGIAWAKRGVAYDAAGNKVFAIRDTKVAVKLDPVNQSYRFNLARLYYQSGQPDKGANIASSLLIHSKWLIPSAELMIDNGMKGQELLGRLEKDPDILVKIGNLMSKMERFDDARLFLMSAAVIAGDEQRYLDYYANLLLRNKKYDDLIRIRDIFKNKPPLRALYWAGEGYLRNRQPDKAAEVLQKLVETDSKNVNYVERLAEVYLQLKEYDNALFMAHRAVKLDEKSHRGYSVSASVYEKRGAWYSASESLKKAVFLQPKHFYLHFRLARAYEKLGFKEHAIKEYELCLELRPDNIGTRLSLGDLYVEENRLNEAIEQYETILLTDPSNRAVLQRLERMR